MYMIRVLFSNYKFGECVITVCLWKLSEPRGWILYIYLRIEVFNIVMPIKMMGSVH